MAPPIGKLTWQASLESGRTTFNGNYEDVCDDYWTTSYPEEGCGLVWGDSSSYSPKGDTLRLSAEGQYRAWTSPQDGLRFNVTGQASLHLMGIDEQKIPLEFYKISADDQPSDLPARLPRLTRGAIRVSPELEFRSPMDLPFNVHVTPHVGASLLAGGDGEFLDWDFLNLGLGAEVEGKLGGAGFAIGSDGREFCAHADLGNIARKVTGEDMLENNEPSLELTYCREALPFVQERSHKLDGTNYTRTFDGELATSFWGLRGRW